MFKCADIITDLLTGQKISFGELGNSIETARMSWTGSALEVLEKSKVEALPILPLNVIETAFKGSYHPKDSSNEQSRATFNLDNKEDEEKFTWIVDCIFPRTKVEKLQKTHDELHPIGTTFPASDYTKYRRISLLMPTSANQPGQPVSGWTHYHIKHDCTPKKNGLGNLINSKNDNYAIRLSTAFNLIGIFTPRQSKDHSYLFSDMIKKSNMQGHFYEVYAAKDQKKLEDGESVEQTDLMHQLPDSRYFIFLKSLDQNIKKKYRAVNFKSSCLESGIGFNSIKLPDISVKKPTYQEEERQKLLEGISYILSIFSGKIITLDVELNKNLKEKLNPIKHKKTDLNRTKSIGPTLIAPSPLIDMLNDLTKHNISLQSRTIDTHSKIDFRRYKKRKPLSISKERPLQIRSLLSIPLLAEKEIIEYLHLSEKPAFNPLSELLNKIRSGGNIKENITLLEKKYNIIIKSGPMDQLLPPHPLYYPMPDMVIKEPDRTTTDNNL